MSAAPPADEEFLDRVTPGLLRAAWLIAGDAELATAATTSALARALADRRPGVSGEQTQFAYAALLRVLPDTQGPVSGHRPSDEVGRRQHDCIAAFRQLPRRDREAVVLSCYTELGDLDVCHILRRAQRGLDDAVQSGLAWLRTSGDHAEPPWFDVRVPAVAPERGAVMAAALSTRPSRRRYLLAAGAGFAGIGAVAAGWWLNRPYAGEAALGAGVAEALRRGPPGRLFRWVRERTDPGDLSVVELVGQDGPGPVMRLARSGADLTAFVAGRDLPAQPTPWGWMVTVKNDHYAVTDVPLDADGLWILDPTPQPAVQENPAWGVELPGGRAVGVALDQRFSIGPPKELLWRTHSGVVRTGSGAPAYALEVQDVTAVLFGTPRTVVLLDSLNSVLFAQAASEDVMFSQYSGGGRRMLLHVLPTGARDVVADAVTPEIAVDTATFEAIDRTMVLAVGSDFTALDQPLIYLSWTIDGHQTSRREP